MNRLFSSTTFATTAILGSALGGILAFFGIRAAQTLHLSTLFSEALTVCAGGIRAIASALTTVQGAALLSGLTIGVLFCSSFLRQWFATRRFLQSLKFEARERDVVTVASDAPLCFTAGLFRPRIYIAAAVRERLRHQELTAVLAHEHAHVKRRDPLRNALLRATAQAFFFLPIFRALEQRYRVEQEVSADAEALHACGGAHALASALYALSAPDMPLSTVPCFARRGTIDIRIAFMEGQRYIPIPITLSKIGVSLAVSILFVLFLIPSSHAEIREPIRCAERSASTLIQPVIHNPWIHQ